MRIGRIYKIITSNSNEIYIGSTFNELRYRMSSHRTDWDRWNKGKRSKVSSFELFEKHGIENCKIILIKEYEVVDKQHLKMFEQLWINKLKPINSQSSFRIVWLSKKEYQKGRYQKRLQNNPNHCKDHYRRQLQKNPDLNKDHYQRKLELHPDYNTKKITCECGLEVNKKHLSRHRKSKNHQKQLQNIPDLYLKVTCECGVEISKRNISTHRKTEKHQNNLSKDKEEYVKQF